MIFSNFEFESTSDEPISSTISSSSIQRDVSSLRIRLLPLMALESTLTSELNGGISIAGGHTRGICSFRLAISNQAELVYYGIRFKET